MLLLFFSVAKGNCSTYILSFLLCTSGNADGALRFAGSKNNPLALRINGWINIAFGVTGIIATFVVSHGDQ